MCIRDRNWSKRDADWKLDEFYGMIRRLQPDAMIINNTGLSRQGEAGHPELDSVTFEQGQACLLYTSTRCSQWKNITK